jgi:methyl-accepting chemotaxis protein
MNIGLSITQKLLIMLLAPLLGLVFFATNAILDKADIVRDMNMLNDLASVAVEASNLTHELQRERGISAGFVVSKGARFAGELQAQRAETDKALAGYRRALASIEMAGFDIEFREVIAQANTAVDTLSSRRDGTNTFAIRSEDVIQHYSAMNSALLRIVAKISDLASNAEMSQRLMAYYFLLQEKEMAGVERAMLSAAFGLDRFTGPEHYARFIGVVAEQSAFNRMFTTYAKPDEISLSRTKLAGSANQELLRLRSIAIDRYGQSRLGVDADLWFAAATARIDVLGEVSVVLASNITGQAAEFKSDAQRELNIFALMATAALLAALGLAYIMGRSVSRPLSEASDAAREVAQQIVSTTRQQGSSASETATAVSQTTATVDEIRQTSEIAAKKAASVSELAGQSMVTASDALKAVEHGVDAMRRIRDEVESIARNILDLSEKNMQIGDIVQSVSAIAEQSNLLAVNASIEAAKAGEHGKGFSVVASEVKALAGQSKEAAGQIRSILAMIQKSSNAAVMVTEQGTKRVEEGSILIEGLGSTITDLGQVIEETTDSTRQIAATANQQVAGIEQITGAMRNIEQATQDNAAGITQLEQAAQRVRAVSEQLTAIVSGKRGTA